MKEKTHCPFCGNRLIQKHLEGRLRFFCEDCNEPIYENPTPATCLVVLDQNRQLLLAKRSVEPKIGEWCLPGGFMELDESPEEAALRELQEETGLHGKIDKLLGVTTAPNRLYGTVLMVGYLVTDYSGELTPGDDVAEAYYFDPNRLPEIAFRSHDHFIRIACSFPNP